MAKRQFTLDEPEGFLDAVRANWSQIEKDKDRLPQFEADSIYCARSGGQRRVNITYYQSAVTSVSKSPPPIPPLRSGNRTVDLPSMQSPDLIDELNLPAVFTLRCLQCDALFTTLLYRGPQGRMVVTLPQNSGGITSPHTPAGVAYYLDQAARAHSVGAHSAAITMFRSAAEWLLEEQGYHARMLGPKLTQLEDAISNGAASAWATQVKDVLRVFRDLGKMATHTNSGDLYLQAAFDASFSVTVQAAFEHLLEVVYETPLRSAARLEALQKALDKSSGRS